MALPPCEMLEGRPRTQCPRDMGTKDPELERVTADSLLGATIRLVGGYTRSSQKWSRTRISYMVFTILDLGWAHMADLNAAEVLQAIALRLPDLAKKAWPAHWKDLQTTAGSRAVAIRFRGLTTQPEDMNWLLDGWSEICRLGPVQSVYTDEWFKSHGEPVIRWMKANGLKEKRTFGLGVRLRNTSGTELDKLKRAVSSAGSERAGVDSFLAGYDSDRVAKLNSWPEFKGEIDKWPDPSDLPWDSSLPANLSLTSAYSTVQSKWPWVVGIGAAGVAAYLFLASPRQKRRGNRR